MPLRIAHISNEAFGLETASGVQQAVYCLEAALDRLEPDSGAFRHVQEQLRRAS